MDAKAKLTSPSSPKSSQIIFDFSRPHHTPPNDQVALIDLQVAPLSLRFDFHDHCPNLDTIRLLKQPTNKSLLLQSIASSTLWSNLSHNPLPPPLYHQDKICISVSVIKVFSPFLSFLKYVTLLRHQIIHPGIPMTCNFWPLCIGCTLSRIIFPTTWVCRG